MYLQVGTTSSATVDPLLALGKIAKVTFDSVVQRNKNEII